MQRTQVRVQELPFSINTREKAWGRDTPYCLHLSGVHLSCCPKSTVFRTQLLSSQLRHLSLGAQLSRAVVQSAEKERYLQKMSLLLLLHDRMLRLVPKVRQHELRYQVDFRRSRIGIVNSGIKKVYSLPLSILVSNIYVLTPCANRSSVDLVRNQFLCWLCEAPNNSGILILCGFYIKSL